MKYDQIIKDYAAIIFTEIEETEKLYNDALAARDRAPKTVDAESVARRARAEADYLKARDIYTKMKNNLPGDVASKLYMLRSRLERELRMDNAPDPAQMDEAALRLLDSGILKPEEIGAMLRKYADNGNMTMARLIAKRAENEAAKLHDADPLARELRVISQSVPDPVALELEEFDHVAEFIRRATKNSAMIKYWPEYVRERLGEDVE